MIRVLGVGHVLLVPQMTPVSATNLRLVKNHLTSHRTEIVAAHDFLFLQTVTRILVPQHGRYLIILTLKSPRTTAPLPLHGFRFGGAAALDQGSRAELRNTC